ncbi:MAG: hypothetical protein RMJ34_01350 [candidate division WOR-3 bacterium]|nr:hypothetical protein [candidate division WOR-3 bacterium]MDW8113565.1 hypothetical protein [candidate division WOR-3 bacterium]
MRKVISILLLPSLFLLLSALNLRFSGPQFILDQGVPIDVGYYSAPLMFDWNGDGKKDLITGQFDYGKIRFYPNIGEDTAPVFSGFSYLRANGVEITLPYG